MDALVVASFSSGMPATRLDVDGDLVLAQRQALPASVGGIFSPYLLTPLPRPEDAVSADELEPRALLAAARGRNFTLRFDVLAPMWTLDAAAPGAASPAPLQSVLGTAARAFTLQMRARVPEGAVRVRPLVSEELRWGWIQYLSFLVLSAAVAWGFRWALFALGVVDASLVVDSPYASGPKLHTS